MDADIDATDAWEITTGSTSITMAILDTGLEPTNAEFAGRIVAGYDFINNDTNPADDQAHGTNVTGLATMKGNNNFGLVGVDWRCKIMPVKVLSADNTGPYSAIAAGIIYAVDRGADVINMSLGGTGFSQAMLDAVRYAYSNNVVVVAAMGNDNANLSFYPASHSETIAVGATDINDHRVRPAYTGGAWGSNYGNHIDVVAPGNSMLSARYNDNQSFTWWMGGTSQATPLVAGTATLLLGIDPTLGVEEIRAIIRSTAEDKIGLASEDTPGFDIYHGAGRLNTHRAVLRAQCPPGTACNDGNPLTINDTYGANCACEGVRAVTLTAPSGGSSYQWWRTTGNAASPIGGANGTGYNPTQAGVYFATYQFGGCGASSDYGIITEDCNDRRVILRLGANTGSFRWYRDGQLINGATGPNLTVTATNTISRYHAVELNCADEYPAFTVLNIANCSGILPDNQDVFFATSEDSDEASISGSNGSSGSVEAELRLSPNPLSRYQKLRVTCFHADKSTVQLRVVDFNGKVLQQHQLQLAEGRGELELSVHQLPSGMYYLVSDRGEVQRFVVAN
ncbi:MAG: S8 family peptidase [Bacteroidota bacterium]